MQIDDPVRGEVERVFGTMLGENYMVVEGEQVLPEGTCLVEKEGRVCTRPGEAAD